MNDEHFEITFAGKDYYRTILCLGVPRVGESVAVDHLVGVVASVMWDVTSGKPNGRSVTVYLKERE